MELCFKNEYVGGEAVTILRVKSGAETDFKGSTRVETKKSNMIVTDTFNVLKKTRHDTDSEGNHYEWYMVENHYQTQERFTPEKQEEVDKNMEKQRGDIDYMAMVLDVELEV